jgi:predicted RNase H-like nuclease
MERRPSVRDVSDDPWRHVGVDWDSGSWVAVGYPSPEGGGSGPAVAVFETVEELWAAHGAAADRVVVDVPIGLCESREASAGCVETNGELSRLCDDLARRVIGPRSSSVFTAPCRDAARAAAAAGDEDVPYDEVNATNRDRTGKGLMRQAANIAPGIVEVEDLLLDADDPTALVEGHPEVCVRAFADEDLQYSKRTAPGVAERLAALERATGYEPGTWRTLAERLGERGVAVGVDDLVDALVLALTARAPDDELWTLPTAPPTDAEGLPVQMVYRRAEPFDVG